ncbi:MAG TPA: sigma 54-interacting transcriptional regulator, partial [Candidatus Methylomirabilis sp.]|nr:sigma 54-interacting transcriptional regulator [Candidatus Methylomirabilis sp.]
MVALREKVREFLRRQAGANRQPPVLIQGETGTGKGLLAHALHDAGPRGGGPFIDVNCAAIPEPLLEAELFGYERGAFTDARQAKPGLFQTAHGGTLFLDEIGLLPSALQSKLLSVLEAGAVRRLGSTRSQPVNVWIVAATNEDLAVAVRTRRFRADLYHRLAVMTFTLPPLRDRGRDVLLIAERVLAQLCEEYGLPRKSLDDRARAVLEGHDWPGNIRELSNTIERAVLLSDAAVLTADLLQIAPPPPSRERRAVPLEAPSPATAARMQLLEALTRTSWNISHTAALLGLSRNTVRARIERFALSAPGARARPGARVRPAADALDAESPGVLPPAPESPAPPVSVRWDRRRIALLRVGLGDGERTESPPLEWSGLLKVAIEKVQSFGGTVEDVSLDGIEASFGLAPMEDPPRRAAHAGLAICRELTRSRSEARYPATRIAIHTCEVPVVYAADSPRVDGQSRRQMAPLLDALVAAAAPGTMVASETAAAFLRRRFVLEPAPRATPELALCRVVGHEQFNTGEAEKGTRFVGRHQELALLQARLGGVVAGRGQVVTVIGDPGMGKSRLVWEFTRSTPARAARVIETGSAYAAITPYLPIIELV